MGTSRSRKLCLFAVTLGTLVGAALGAALGGLLHLLSSGGAREDDLMAFAVITGGLALAGAFYGYAAYRES